MDKNLDKGLCFMGCGRPCRPLPNGRVSAICGSPECNAAMSRTVVQGAKNAERMGLAPKGFAAKVRDKIFPS